MSDYSAVAPPQNFQSTAFAAALQRAKQIAAKINPSGSTGSTTSQKRPLEDGSEPEAKKVASLDNSQSGIGGAAAQAAAQAAAVAARVAAASSHGLGGLGAGGMGPGIGGPVVSEDIKVPDKMVGLIIGRGGEQITRLQSESGCKIQMAPDSAGQPERVCSLAGTREAINRAKELIMNIVHQRGRTEGYGPMGDMGGGGGGGGGGGAGGGSSGGGGGGGGVAHIEIMVPGPKVGLIIGKGGETIKQLQEKSGAKMVVIQDGPNQEQEKPLRISGEHSKVEYAKQLVYDLIAEKEMQAYSRRGGRNDEPGRGPGLGQGGGYSDYGPPSNNGEGVEVAVPRAAVGVVIGKGGDMIKKIQAETGARVQFQQGRDEGPGDRRCLLTGKPQHVDMARQRIEELIDSVIRRDEGSNAGGGRNNGRGGRNDRGGGGGYDRMGPGGPRNGQDYGGGAPGGGGWGPDRADAQMEVTFVVPSNKCGVIIGKGGETIKQINQQSGAHCELDRRATGTTPGSDKTFVIRGSPDQVENCKRIISEKVQMLLNFVCTSGNGMPQTAAYPGMAPQGYNPQGWGAPGAYQQQWPQAGAQPDPSTMPVPNQVQVNPQTGQPDYSMQWAEYYRSLGMHREAEMIEQQAKTKAAATAGGLPGMAPGTAPGAPGVPQPQPGAPGATPTPTQQPGAPAAAAAGAVPNGAAAQPDYSAQWAEYYRSIGKIKEAEAIEAQMKNKGGAPAAGAGQAAPGTQVLAGGGAPGTQPTQAAQFQQQPQAQAAYGAYPQATGYYAAQQQPGAPQAAPQGQYNFPTYGYGQPGAPDN